MIAAKQEKLGVKGVDQYAELFLCKAPPKLGIQSTNTNTRCEDIRRKKESATAGIYIGWLPEVFHLDYVNSSLLEIGKYVKGVAEVQDVLEPCSILHGKCSSAIARLMRIAGAHLHHYVAHAIQREVFLLSFCRHFWRIICASEQERYIL